MAYRKKMARRAPARRSNRSSRGAPARFWGTPARRSRSSAPRTMKLVIQVQQNAPAPMDAIYAPQAAPKPRRAKF